MMKSVKLGIIVLYFLLILSVTVFASMDCPTKEEYRLVIKEAIKDYLTYPSHEKLLQLQDMLKIYATHDFTKCLEEEAEYSFTQICSDGTAYSTCSVAKPLYCDNGNLVNNCQVCGCNANFGCQADGSCVALACSDSTLYNQCSTNKPLFCQDGTLINGCSVCGCNENQICKTDESCLNKAEAKRVILLIIEADKILAQKALETAEKTLIKYPENYEPNVKQEIERSKQSLAQANIEAEASEYTKAVDDYKTSWEHSQEAIKLANTPCPPNCVGKCGGASDGCGGSCNAACPADQVCTNGICTTKPKEEKPLIVKIIETIVKVIVTIVKAIVKFFKKLFRW